MSILRSESICGSGFMKSNSCQRLVIHAGTHKTASTTLQVALHRNRSVLAERGVFYPKPPIGNAQHYLVSEWVPQLQAKYPSPQGPEADWQAIDQLAQHGPIGATVVLSSEEFSRRAPAFVDFRTIVARTPSFDRHEVVVVLRDQISLLQSVFLQIRQNNPVSSFPLWVEQALGGGENPGLFFDYSALHAHLQSAFAAECISYLPYASFNDHPQGGLGRFLGHLGYEGIEGLQLVGPRNVSMSPLGFYVGQALLEGAVPSPLQAASVAEVLLARHPGKQDSTLYTKAEIEDLAARFAQSNQSFANLAEGCLKGPVPLMRVEDRTLHRCEVTAEDKAAARAALAVKR